PSTGLPSATRGAADGAATGAARGTRATVPPHRELLVRQGCTHPDGRRLAHPIGAGRAACRTSELHRCGFGPSGAPRATVRVPSREEPPGHLLRREGERPVVRP